MVEVRQGGGKRSSRAMVVGRLWLNKASSVSKSGETQEAWLLRQCCQSSAHHAKRKPFVQQH